MKLQPKMTIEDYIQKASGRSKIIRQDLKPQKETQASSASTFNGILSTFKKPSNQSEPKTMKGLSLTDYRSHLVKSAYTPTARNLTTDPKAPDPSAYKEASEYFFGPESPNAKVPISPETGVDDLTQNISSSGFGNRLKMPFPPSGSGMPPLRSGTTRHTIEKAIQDAAVQYQLSPKLIKGVIKAESNYDANAVSPAGAQGLMQLMPGTARDLGVKDPFDIKQNIDGGVRYLRKMMDMFGGNVRKALSAYNAGPETVKRYNGDVPYSETRQYVDRVINHTKTAV